MINSFLLALSLASPQAYAIYVPTQPVNVVNFSTAGASSTTPFYITNLSTPGASTTTPFYIQWTPANTLTTDINLVGSSITFTNPGAITNPNYIQLNTSFSDGDAIGRLQWDIDHNLPSFGLSASVSGNVFDEMLTRAYNDTGSPLVDGDVVYQCGVQAHTPKICKARADAVATADVLGVVTEPIADKNYGFVCPYGDVHDINTNAYTAGQKVYLSSITAGAITATVPYGASSIVEVGEIRDKSPSLGVLRVKVVRVPDAIRVSSLTATEICLNGSCQTAFPGSVPKPHAVLYSTVTQSIASTAANQHITFSTTAQLYQITQVNQSTWQVTTAGVYEFCFSGISDLATFPAAATLEVWLRHNGVDVVDSNTRVGLAAANTETTVAVCLLEDMQANDTFTMMTYGSDTDLRWLYTAAGTSPTRPATPSVILTVKKMSELE